jgi:hypothetical protein
MFAIFLGNNRIYSNFIFLANILTHPFINPVTIYENQKRFFRYLKLLICNKKCYINKNSGSMCLVQSCQLFF